MPLRGNRFTLTPVITSIDWDAGAHAPGYQPIRSKPFIPFGAFLTLQLRLAVFTLPTMFPLPVDYKNTYMENSMRDAFKPLSGMNAFVTGGSKGIGRAICLGLAEAGAAVALTGRSADDGAGTARATATEIKQAGGRALPIVCDVRNAEGVRTAITSAVKTFGRLDILVNNAGLYFPGVNAIDMELSQWDETIETHIRGSFLCARFAAQNMADHGGSIINMSSTAGDPGHDSTGNLAYCVAKAGIEQMTRGLARELAPLTSR